MSAARFPTTTSLARGAENTLRRILRVALGHFVLNGVGVALGLLLISGLAHLLLGPAAGTAVAVGVLIATPPDLPAPRHHKFWQMLPSVVLGLPLFFAVQLLHAAPIRLGLLLVPATFIAFLFMAWGKRGIPLAISVNLALVFSLATPPSGDWDEALALTTHVALGAGCYLVYATLFNMAVNGRYRVALLAALMRAQARRFMPDGSPQALGELLRLQAALADQLQDARNLILESPNTLRRQRLAALLMNVLEVRDHVLACELDLQALAQTRDHAHAMQALGRVIEQLADQVEALADALLLGRAGTFAGDQRPLLDALGLRPSQPRGERATPEALAQEAAAPLADAAPDPAHALVRSLADRVGHINDEILRMSAIARGDRAPDLRLVRGYWQLFVSPTSWSLQPLLTLWHWDAPPLRHAVRASLAVACGYAVGAALPWGSHEYWILLTIVVVLRGSLAQTIERRNSRVAGTLMGCVLALGLLALHPSPLVLLMCLTVAQGTAHAFGVRKYVVTAVAASVLGLAQAHMLNRGVSPAFALVERVADTLIGAGIAWMFSYVFPSWERSQLRRVVRRVMAAQARHAKTALSLTPLEAPDNAPELAWRLARREVYDSLSALVQVTQRALFEPRAVRPPIEPLEQLQIHSYQLLAQLSAVKSLLLLQRGQLYAERAAVPMRYTSEYLARTLSMADLLDPNHIPAPPDTKAITPDDTLGSTTLPSPLEQDVTPWLLHRLASSVSIARDLRQDAYQALTADQAAIDARAVQDQARAAQADSKAIT
ncbi:MAG: Inner membrane protein YccS [Paracidovorax wautersii]|uniref:Inner membrane protein YccS n=1 Tax=Paracidovorax wautersii TaxID=1177982 RepID=A0A7V8JPP8_9BURK|nr:MAG: Inner membrane protein YccS [Paracidovorax wautersii]